ncbi:MULTISPECIES: metal ABC transporter ATP-binding protein [Pasteurellaceae]|uniref:ATP-binding cassette domain-containing protein n=1 Tax=Pasteurella atlantica TaxID=2827233 RepID=A0AAW8CPN9_9PAST|nr:ATP-binding cassette domain-containing protein [Pasteurella atlantica]MBR0574450.1 ATP-binding cassette domain-containing protein [Pasteurella atlantica]MDP8039327.1 ATP-binding cassette domain-containing protein [Pasteurella atlantica]MDP8041419.1 ATP-binding cassette domain-containing protein [Pasteurella atlantica]MDP8043656.1 ATP-binding cassette domain-containing protein [Pasteurella atlantica]MDP8045640.1 ATP-binding cassette domain-containing protein [Pasteurella atlantica]
MKKALPSICAKDVTVRYNNGHTAIYDVSFQLEGGTTCALVGTNGSGKSTLFKSIMGLVNPQKGQIKLCGLPINQALKQNLIAYVPQTEEIDWQFPISVYDVVLQGRYGYMNFLRIPSKEDKRIVQQAMERLGIEHLAQRQIGELSGGQKKRVFLSRALAQQSRIILLDEPFTGVDINTENTIMQLLSELREEGALILVSTHNLESVPYYCDHTIMIDRTVIAVGDIKTTFVEENIKKAFGGSLRSFQEQGQTISQSSINE